MESPTNKVLELNKQKLIRILRVNANPTSKQNNPGNNFIQNPIAINILKPSPSSIIRIAPDKTEKLTLSETNSLRTCVVTQSNTSELKTLHSASLFNAIQDHEYVHKEKRKEEIKEDPSNVIYFNESESMVDSVNDTVYEQELESTEPVCNTKKRHIEYDILRVPKKLNMVHSTSCCYACRTTLEIILQNQNEILRLLKNGVSNPSKCDIRLDLLPSMPFKNLNDFLDFDESLTNENVLDQLITKFQRLLVAADKKSVSNIMSSIMTNDLCKQISWIGIKDTIAFQNTIMVNHIIDVIQDHHGLDVDLIKSFVAEWLRRCSDRIASEKRKHKKKAQRLGQ